MSGEVWILVEHSRGALLDTTYELLAEGSKIAQKLTSPLCAVLLGHNVSDLIRPLAHYGAGKIYLADSPIFESYALHSYFNCLSTAAGEFYPELIMMGNTRIGCDLAPSLAAKLTVGLASDCTFLDVDYAGELQALRPIYREKATATVKFGPRRPRLATFRAGLASQGRADSHRTAEVVYLQFPTTPSEAKTRSLGVFKADLAEIDLTEADVVVAGGRGVGSAENFRLLYDLAELLRGKVGGTRFAADMGWISQEQQIGQTGKTVTPSLYIACGISGAVHHLAGMRESKTVIAINTDRSAPIFKIADVAILGDLLQVIPIMMETIETK